MLIAILEILPLFSFLSASVLALRVVVSLEGVEFMHMVWLKMQELLFSPLDASKMGFIF